MSVIAIGSMWEYMRCHSKSGKSIFLHLQLLSHFCSDLQCANHTFFPLEICLSQRSEALLAQTGPCVCVCWEGVGSWEGLAATRGKKHTRTNRSPFHTLFNVPPGSDLACGQFVCVCVCVCVCVFYLFIYFFNLRLPRTRALGCCSCSPPFRLPDCCEV